MIHFMVDFENVRNHGLKGCEYLNANDKITIFYSACCVQVESEKMQRIFHSGCEFDICKLIKTGKNALDFYIASRIGEIYGSGYTGDVAIVSNDKGFCAVQEYWQSSPYKRRIILKGTIAQCIAASGEKSKRSKEIVDRRKTVNIETEFERYKERKRIQEEITELFANTGYANEIGNIIDIIQAKKTPKVLYLNTLKQFGKKDGLQIYRKIKEVV